MQRRRDLPNRTITQDRKSERVGQDATFKRLGGVEIDNLVRSLQDSFPGFTASQFNEAIQALSASSVPSLEGISPQEIDKALQTLSASNLPSLEGISPEKIDRALRAPQAFQEGATALFAGVDQQQIEQALQHLQHETSAGALAIAPNHIELNTAITEEPKVQEPATKPLLKTAKRRGRPAKLERRQAIGDALRKHGGAWRDHLSEIFMDLDDNEVSLGIFQGKKVDLGDGESQIVRKWSDLDLAQGDDCKRIIDALRNLRVPNSTRLGDLWIGNLHGQL
jgi:hypothetical protein